MSLSTLLAALAAKEGKAYFTEFMAYMTALNENVEDLSAALMTSVQTASSSSVAIGTGEKTFTVAAGKLFVTGMPVRAAYDASNYMDAAVVSYSGTTLVINVAAADDAIGSGTRSSWTITMTGDEGPTGPSYWNTPRVIATGDSPVTALDRDILLVRTGTGAVEIDFPATGAFQVIDVDGAAATNNITCDPPGGETIMDGAADETFVIDIAWFAATFTRRTGGTNWSVS